MNQYYVNLLFYDLFWENLGYVNISYLLYSFRQFYLREISPQRSREIREESVQSKNDGVLVLLVGVLAVVPPKVVVLVAESVRVQFEAPGFDLGK